MTRDGLVQDVEAALGRLEPYYKRNADPSDLYEAALLTIAVDAVRAAGATNVFATKDGSHPAVAIYFRRSPGNLWTDGFSYILARFGSTGKSCEVHLGIYVAGESGVAHECDVAILDSAEAERSRRGNIHPRKSGVIAAIEAKHYVASPGIGIGRSFLGLASELGHPKSTLAFPACSSASVARLLARRSSQCFDEVSPGTPAAKRLKAHLDQKVRNWLVS